MTDRAEYMKKYQREWSRRWRSKPENRAKHTAWARRWQVANPVRFAVQNSRKGAATRGIEWTLDDGLATDLITDRCFYCGADPAPVNGIDRVDSARGYVVGNVVAACRSCNYSKRQMSVGQWLAWVDRLSARLPMLADLAQET